MEHKIGEIFEYNEEWYQCLKGISCEECDFSSNGITCDIYGAITCTRKGRSDDTSVVFKKLEKIGGPYDDCGTILQKFKIYTNVTNADTKGLELHIYSNNTIGIEIKPNKENMEEKKLDPHMEKVIDEATQKMGKEIRRQIEMNLNKQNIKPFSLEQAKAGKPVCTKNGKKARIICFDAKGILPIIALVESGDEEKTVRYSNSGRFRFDGMPDEEDLMMLPEKKDGWILLPKKDAAIFTDKELAERSCTDSYFVAKVSWEE